MFTAFSDGLQPSPETRPKGQCGDTGFGFLLPATVLVDLLTSTVQETQLSPGFWSHSLMVQRAESKETQLTFQNSR